MGVKEECDLLWNWAQVFFALIILGVCMFLSFLVFLGAGTIFVPLTVMQKLTAVPMTTKQRVGGICKRATRS